MAEQEIGIPTTEGQMTVFSAPRPRLRCGEVLAIGQTRTKPLVVLRCWAGWWPSPTHWLSQPWGCHGLRDRR